MSTNNTPSSEDNVIVKINFFGQEYQVSCKEQECDPLKQSVQDLQERARSMKKTYQLTSTESVLMMMCLNMEREIKIYKELKATIKTNQHAIDDMYEKIECMLERAPEQLRIL